MHPLALTTQALAEPWRLWTGHLIHYGGAHALANGIALLVPFALAPQRERPRLALALLLLAPLLSLCLLPTLRDAEYRGASGLACALWTLVGFRALGKTRALGLLLLGGLGLKLVFEACTGGSFLLRSEGWRSLPAAHFWGAALGSGFALVARLRPHPAGRGTRATQRS
jgi:membrane associated rhomboid family serine protease